MKLPTTSRISQIKTYLGSTLTQLALRPKLLSEGPKTRIVFQNQQGDETSPVEIAVPNAKALGWNGCALVVNQWDKHSVGDNGLQYHDDFPSGRTREVLGEDAAQALGFIEQRIRENGLIFGRGHPRRLIRPEVQELYEDLKHVMKLDLVIDAYREGDIEGLRFQDSFRNHWDISLGADGGQVSVDGTVIHESDDLDHLSRIVSTNLEKIAAENEIDPEKLAKQTLEEISARLTPALKRLELEMHVDAISPYHFFIDFKNDIGASAGVYVYYEEGSAKVQLHDVKMVPFAEGWSYPEVSKFPHDSDVVASNIDELCADCEEKLSRDEATYINKTYANISTNPLYVDTWRFISAALLPSGNGDFTRLHVGSAQVENVFALEWNMPKGGDWKLAFDYDVINIHAITLFVDGERVASSEPDKTQIHRMLRDAAMRLAVEPRAGPKR